MQETNARFSGGVYDRHWSLDIFPVSQLDVVKIFPDRVFAVRPNTIDKNQMAVIFIAVYLELVHRGYFVSVGKLPAKEIDFVAEKGTEKLYIQVCYLLSDSRTEDREFGPLLAIPDNHPKFVLSMDRDWGNGKEGIRRVYLPAFLLGAGS